jgi:hypothetical protein
MQRVRSNTPLQALAQLNDEVMIEASQALAKRIVEEERGDESARLNHAFQLCLTRSPSAEERRALLDYFHKQQQKLLLDEADAATVAGVTKGTSRKPEDVAELAAWTLVSRALLNLDEAISKE